MSTPEGDAQMDSSKQVKKLTKRLILIQVAVILLLLTAGAIIVLRRLAVEPFVDYRAQMRELAIQEFGENPDPRRSRELLLSIIEIATTRYMENPTATDISDLVLADDDVHYRDVVSASSELLDWDGEPWNPFSSANSDPSAFSLTVQSAQRQGILDLALQLSELAGTGDTPVVGDDFEDKTTPYWGSVRTAGHSLRSLVVWNAIRADRDGLIKAIRASQALSSSSVAEPGWLNSHVAFVQSGALSAWLQKGLLRQAFDRKLYPDVLEQLNTPAPVPTKAYLLRASELEVLAELQDLYHGTAQNGQGELPDAQPLRKLKLAVPHASVASSVRQHFQSIQSHANKPSSDLMARGRSISRVDDVVSMPEWSLTHLSNLGSLHTHQLLDLDYNLTSYAALRILLAIEIHRDRNGGTPPTTLNEIADLFGGTIPIDAMSGLPFVYHPDAAAAGFAGVSDTPFILYSAGLNGTIHNNPTADYSKARDPGFDYLWSALPKDDD